MENFIDLCNTRYSCRNYSDKPVEHEKLVKCIEAARLTPSACNSQPWSFIVVENKEKVSQIAAATQQIGINKHTEKTQAFIIVVEEYAKLMPALGIVDSRYYANCDLGAATYGICLQAADLGLGSSILGVFDRNKIKETLDIPKEKHIFMVISIGYPADESPSAKRRKDFDSIVQFVQ